MKRVLLVVAVFAVLASRAMPSAHEIPRSLTVNMFVKAEGDRLEVLIRLPLAAMRDIEFPQRDGFLEISKSEPLLRDAITQWILPDLRLFQNGRLLPAPEIRRARISLPSDRSFASFEGMRGHMAAAPLDGEIRLPREQAVLDVWLAYPIATGTSTFSVNPGFQRLGVDVVTALRFINGDVTRAFEFSGDPGLVRLDPRWHQAAARFVTLGFLHILDGTDHLLFLTCLVIPLRRLRSLVLVVSAFTAAHSITLIGSAMGVAPDGLWFPPLVELLVAASIVYMAIENIVASPSLGRRTAMAFAFGLVHGFAFSFALKETLQFAGAHLLASLLSFNAGVELGQLFVLAALVPTLYLLVRFVMTERMATVVLSVLVGHTAWHWMTERWTTLRAFGGAWLGTIPLLSVVRLSLLILLAMALVWFVRWHVARRRAGGTSLEESRDAGPA